MFYKEFRFPKRRPPPPPIPLRDKVKEKTPVSRRGKVKVLDVEKGTDQNQAALVIQLIWRHYTSRRQSLCRHLDWCLILGLDLSLTNWITTQCSTGNPGFLREDHRHCLYLSETK